MIVVRFYELMATSDCDDSKTAAFAVSFMSTAVMNGSSTNTRT